MKKIKYILIGAAMILGLSASTANAQKSNEMSLHNSVRTFSELLSKLQQYYVDTLDIRPHMEDGIRYMLRRLDPYTEYFTEEEAEQFVSDSNGEFGGIGIRIATYGGQAYFTEPMLGQPAYNAGLRSGDKVIKVDSVDTRGRDSNFVTKLVRGHAGTPVTITVVRPYQTDSILTVTLERAKIRQPAVEYSTILPNGIAYINLSTFSADDTGAQVRHILEQFKQTGNLKGLILDLRNNGGGLLTQAIDIASMFVPRGTKILETKGPENNKIYTTKKDPIFANLPMAVLIGRGSASASEVLAGALQDLDRAVLVGDRSFGKGLVQSTLSMPFGAMLKVTTAKYYIPSGRLIQALDYSHRDADGHPGYTPDSLAKVFYTAAGRPVKDGGGLQPEILVPDTFVHPYLLYNLFYGKPYGFDFANRYHAQNPGKTPFVMSDAVWQEFINTLPAAALEYENDATERIKSLRKAFAAENVLNDAVAAQLDSLSTLLAPDAKAELAAARPEVERMLVPMLAERYGNADDMSAAALDFDPVVKSAVTLLLEPARYASLLKKPQSKQPTVAKKTAKPKKK